LASSSGGGGGRIEKRCRRWAMHGRRARRVVSLQRDANAMHFALEPASSARLGFVFFMQLPAREMKHFYLDSQSEKKEEKNALAAAARRKAFRACGIHLSHTCK